MASGDSPLQSSKAQPATGDVAEDEEVERRKQRKREAQRVRQAKLKDAVDKAIQVAHRKRANQREWWARTKAQAEAGDPKAMGTIQRKKESKKRYSAKKRQGSNAAGRQVATPERSVLQQSNESSLDPAKSTDRTTSKLEAVCQPSDSGKIEEPAVPVKQETPEIIDLTDDQPSTATATLPANGTERVGQQESEDEKDVELQLRQADLQLKLHRIRMRK